MELLVSIAILLLILAVCAAMTLTAQNMFSNGTERIDADSQARLFFDRITLDMEAMVKRPDVDYIVKNVSQLQAGNDSLGFYARATGYFSGTTNSAPDPAPRKTLSVLAYRINNQTFQLERLAKGTGWQVAPFSPASTGKQMVFLPATLFGTWTSLAGPGGVEDLNLSTDPDFQVLADSIFRLEYCYILRNGTMSNVPSLRADQALDGWQDVTALYVAIAVLDNRSRQAISNGGTSNPSLGTAISKLPDFPLDGTQTYPPLSQWEAVINQPNFAASANLPPKIAQAVRIYARSIPINLVAPDTTL